MKPTVAISNSHLEQPAALTRAIQVGGGFGKYFPSIVVVGER
jgi:hypothetical protein